MYPGAMFTKTGSKPIGDCSSVFFQFYSTNQDGRIVGKWYTEQLEKDPDKWVMPGALPTPEDGMAIFRTENMTPGIDPRPVDCKKPGRTVVVSSNKGGGELWLFENVPTVKK